MIRFSVLGILPLLLILAACGSKPEPEASQSTKAQACLAEAMYFEARGTGESGRRAVGEVILNRANDLRYPSAVCEVVDQRNNGVCQFSYRCNRSLTYNEPEALARANVTAQILLTNRGEDITNGALFFHAVSMAPGWFSTLSPRGRFGGNLFYR